MTFVRAWITNNCALLSCSNDWDQVVRTPSTHTQERQGPLCKNKPDAASLWLLFWVQLLLPLLLMSEPYLDLPLVFHSALSFSHRNHRRTLKSHLSHKCHPMYFGSSWLWQFLRLPLVLKTLAVLHLFLRAGFELTLWLQDRYSKPMTSLSHFSNSCVSFFPTFPIIVLLNILMIWHGKIIVYYPAKL